ncbi:MAG: OB-fold nucleic acid binding domain-containing protein, partial [Patescibacteria group bacterium]
MYIKTLQQFKDKQTTLKGWIYNLRSSGKIMFLQLRDGTGFCQCILSKYDVSEKKWAEAQNITIESSIELNGLITEHPKQPGV